MDLALNNLQRLICHKIQPTNCCMAMYYNHTYIHIYAEYRLMQWITTSEDFFTKICTSHFIVRVRKGLLKVCEWEGAGDRTELQYFDPHSHGHQRCVFLVLQGCSTGSPEAHSAGWWLSLLHLISNLSPTVSLPVITELYNSSTPTQSLQWDVWSSSSGNNCQCSSQVTLFRCISLWVYHGIFFYLVPFHQPNPTYAISFDYWPLGCVTSFRCITLEWHICPGQRSKCNITNQPTNQPNKYIYIILHGSVCDPV